MLLILAILLLLFALGGGILIHPALLLIALVAIAVLFADRRSV
jgi:hypothetical protein